MTNSTFEDFIAKIKKVAKKPKKSKYYKKFLTIVKKQKEKLHKGKHRLKQPVDYTRNYEHSNEKLLDISNTDSDSGISQDNSPVEPPVSFLTNAIIEPTPRTFSKDAVEKACSKILETSGEIKNIATKAQSYEEEPKQGSSLNTQLCSDILKKDASISLLKQEANSRVFDSGLNTNPCYPSTSKNAPLVPVKQRANESSEVRWFSNSVYQSANGYNPRQKFDRMSLREESKIPSVYQCAPKNFAVNKKSYEKGLNQGSSLILKSRDKFNKQLCSEPSNKNALIARICSYPSVSKKAPLVPDSYVSQCSNYSYRSATGYSPRQKFDRFSLHEESQYTCAPKHFSAKKQNYKEETKEESYLVTTKPKDVLMKNASIALVKQKVDNDSLDASRYSNSSYRSAIGKYLYEESKYKCAPNHFAATEQSYKEGPNQGSSLILTKITPVKQEADSKNFDARLCFSGYPSISKNAPIAKQKSDNDNTAEDCSPVQKLSLDEERKIPIVYSCAPQKPPRLYVKTNSLRCSTPTKPTLRLDIPARNQPYNMENLDRISAELKNLRSKINRFTRAIAARGANQDSDELNNNSTVDIESTTNNINEFTSTLKSPSTIEDLNNNSTVTCSNKIYSNFKEGLSRKGSVKTSNQTKDVNEKFVVNVYESRQSQRWKRQSMPVGQSVTKMKILNDPHTEMNHKMAPVYQNKKTDYTKDEIYFKMKKLRDIECVKMKEASNALVTIKNNADRTWSEELLAESILLETELRYKAIVNKIRDTKEMEYITEKPRVSGGITLSNFQFELVAQEFKKNNDVTTFFMLAVSNNNTNIITSKAIVASEDNKLVFNEMFSLTDLSENFQIKAELFSITLNTTKVGFIEKLLRKKSKCCYPINKIYFENVNTYEMQESTILKPSFTSCGEIIITKNDLESSLFFMQKYQGDKLKSNVSATISVDFVNLNTKLSGFLTLGKMDEDRNIHYWERKWCSLDNNTFSVYNYPQDEQFDKPPAAFINLEYCFNPLIKNPKDCPRKRTFILKTGRPSTLNDSNCKQLRRKNNFILDKYYLSADSMEEFGKWTEQLEEAIEELNAWGKLIFKDDYYL